MVNVVEGTNTKIYKINQNFDIKSRKGNLKKKTRSDELRACFKKQFNHKQIYIQFKSTRVCNSSHL